MKRIDVVSSNIKSIGYDIDLKILEIEFHSKSIYQYSNVPKLEHDGIMNTSSHGKYFHEYIKGKYADKRIS